MRDAAAKFLVQFPRQPIGLQLARGESLVAPAALAAMEGAASEAFKRIEAVPVIEPSTAAPAVEPASAAGGAPT